MRVWKKLLTAIGASTAVAVFGLTGAAFATPSTHVWSPSTDTQAFGVFHLTADAYVPVQRDEETKTRPNTVTNFGLTLGVLPLEKVGLELGFDHIAGFGVLDSYPFYFNAKLGVPEAAFGKYSPAFAIGGYSIGTKRDGEARVNETPELGTDYDVYYAKLAKTLGPLGRFSAGYYTGNRKLLVDENMESDEHGVLLCWERTMSEISDNLWLSVDYMGGESSFGTLSYGAAWKFAPNVSVILGYVDQNNDKLSGVTDTFTMQVDIDFDVFSGKK
jgi:hypothetical protein